MGARRELKAEQREGYLMHFIKSTWYTFALGLFLLAGTLVFMGIEGNHEEFVAYKRLEEQNKFNTTLRAVSCEISEQWVRTIFIYYITSSSENIIIFYPLQ